MKSAFRILTALCACLVALVAVCAGAQTAPDYDALVRQGNAQLQSGNNDAALRPARAAIKLNANRWEAYAVAGGALLNLQRYEEAADNFSEAIKHAPETKLAGLRDLRRKCLLAEAGAPATQAASASPAPSATVTQAEIVLWKTIENSPNPNDLQAYLQQYPNGAFAVLALRRLAWTDPATGLMWTIQWARQDNTHYMDWKQANNYCGNLRLGSYTNWRLATIDELAGIYEPGASSTLLWNGFSYTYHIKGGIQIPAASFSSSQDGNDSVWVFSFFDGKRYSYLLPSYEGALCVRRSGE